MRRFIPILAALIAVAAAAQAAAPAAPPWPKDLVDLAATLPVQDGGRVKPLDTYAQFLMLRVNGMRSFTTPEGDRIGPVEWLLSTVFYPSAARHWPTFLVDNDEALVAIGVPTHADKRDRYTYEEILPGREKLFTRAREYQAIDAKDRGLVEQQVLNLANNVFEFELKLGLLAFARTRIQIEGDTQIAQAFPEAGGVPVSVAFQRVPEVLMGLRGNPMGLNDAQVDAEAKAISGVLSELEAAATQAQGLAIFPPRDPSVKEWFSPGDLMGLAIQMPGVAGPEAYARLAELEALAANRDTALLEGDSPALQAAFGEAFTALHAGLVAQAEARGEYGHIPLEVHFYRAKYLFYSQWLYVLSFVLIALSWLAPGASRFKMALPVSVALPTLLLIVGITLRCIIRGRPPVTTLYETILFITAVAVVVALVIEWMNRQGIALATGSFLGGLGMFLAHRYELKEGVDTMPSLIAVLDTNFWLSTHVTTVTIGYAAALLAGALAHLYIFGRLLRFKRSDPAFYRGLTRMVYGVICFGLIFSAVGTILGGIWANDSWGRFWGWDPKENGALMICLWALVLLHLRMGRYIKDLGIHAGAIVLAMITAFSWWGVNLLGVGLHSYGFTSGIMNLLVIYWAFECVTLAFGAVLFFVERMGKPATA